MSFERGEEEMRENAVRAGRMENEGERLGRTHNDVVRPLGENRLQPVACSRHNRSSGRTKPRRLDSPTAASDFRPSRWNSGRQER